MDGVIQPFAGNVVYSITVLQIHKHQLGPIVRKVDNVIHQISVSNINCTIQLDIVVSDGCYKGLGPVVNPS